MRLGDGYEGWMHEGYLEGRVLGAEEPEAWSVGARYSLGCTVVDSASGMERVLPLGARIGLDAAIVAGEALDDAELRRRYPRRTHGDLRVRPCDGSSSTSYQWGGITPWGADCSGMIQTTFGLHGMALPRDARQQAELGTALALVPECVAGRAICSFSPIAADGRITHVALVAPERTLMHVAIGRGGFCGGAHRRRDGSLHDRAHGEIAGRATIAVGAGLLSLAQLTSRF